MNDKSPETHQELLARIRELEAQVAELSQSKQQNQQITEQQISAYRAIIERFPNGIVTFFDTDLRYVVAGGDGFQNTSHLLVGKRLRDVFPEEIWRRDEPILKAALEGEATIVERQFENKYFIIRTLPVYGDDDEIIGGMVMTQDITSLKMAEMKLARERKQYHDLLATLPMKVTVVALESHHLLYTNTFPSFVFDQPDYDVDMLERLLQNLPAQYHDLMVEIMDRVKQGDIPSPVDLHIPSNNTTETIVSSQTVPITFDGVPAALNISQDVTEQRLAQHHEREALIERERLRMVSDFIIDILHEFSTPLAIISTKSQLIQRLTPQNRITQHADAILEQVDHIERLVNTLTLTAQFDSSEKLDLRPLSPEILLENIIDEWSMQLSNRQVELHTSAASDLPAVLADSTALFVALNELVDNAVRYSASEENPQIAISIHHTEEFIEYTISDNGIGIEPDVLPHIFKRFYRRDSAHSTRGFGLGLPIVARIVDLHHGHVKVTSEVGKGSTFSIYIPITASDTA